MAKPVGLMKVKGTYYYRVKVPLDLVEAFGGKKEIKRSLKTKSPVEARKRRNCMAVEWDARFERARERLEAGETQVSSLSEAEALQLVLHYVFETDRKFRADEAIAAKPTPEQLEDWGVELETELQSLENTADPQGDVMVGTEGAALLSAQGVHLEGLSSERAVFMELMRRALIELTRRSLARHRNDFSTDHYDHLFALPELSESSKLPTGQTITLDELCKRYLDDYIASKAVTAKTLKKTKASLRLICKVIDGNTRLSQIDRERCRNVRDTLGKLPPNLTKKFHNVPIAKVIEITEEQDLPRMKFGTQADYLHMLDRLLKWAAAEKEMAEVSFTGIVPKGKKTPDKEKRDTFDTNQLQAIFDAPLYRGCKNDEAGYKKPGPNVIRRHRFWVPLIALYSGMRQSEICQLNLDDINVTDEGTHYFHICPDDNGKSVKTESSWRMMPIHPELIRMGFLDYVYDLRAKNKKEVFPDLKTGSSGARSQAISRWFNEGFLNSVGAKTAKTNFHSLRHTFRDALRAAEIPKDIAGEIGGWATTGDTIDNYGKGYMPDHLFKYVKKVSYPNLDLSHLYNSSDGESYDGA